MKAVQPQVRPHGFRDGSNEDVLEVLFARFVFAAGGIRGSMNECRPQRDAHGFSRQRLHPSVKCGALSKQIARDNKHIAATRDGGRQGAEIRVETAGGSNRARHLRGEACQGSRAIELGYTT